MVKSNRDTISVNDCQILAHYKYEAEQYIITLASKEIAENTQPGQFVHLSVSGMLAMRRPISVMSVDKENGTFDLLYKIVGEGTRQLADRKIGDVLSVIGPIGNGFKMTDKKIPLLISSLAEGRTETPQTRKMPAPTGPGGGRIAMGKKTPSTFPKAQTPNFLDHYWSRCGEARFVFGWLLYFG